MVLLPAPDQSLFSMDTAPIDRQTDKTPLPPLWSNRAWNEFENRFRGSRVVLSYVTYGKAYLLSLTASGIFLTPTSEIPWAYISLQFVVLRRFN